MSNLKDQDSDYETSNSSLSQSDDELGYNTNKVREIRIEPTQIEFPESYKMTLQSIPTNVCEPGPLGLFSLAIGCCVLIAADFGWSNSGLLLRAPWLFWIPGVAQIIAGIFEIFRKNVFGSFAFVIYGALWCGIAWTYMHVLYAGVEDAHLELHHLGVICVGYEIFSMILFIASLGLNTTFPIILGFIQIALIALVSHIFWGTSGVPIAIGLLVVCVFSYYTGFAGFINTIAGGKVISTGGPFLDWKKYVYKN
ncbi:inner membrane protein yaah [Anaeramoeba flamelloides]|uniref:Inner membrane protein yaah n=1 Tax=Anaeramoeba flamelloides TaxID=1746091 RepID=A0ABQ8Y9B7_9EUKA|nr:inner membrane protein yaah [Anaeramoeba flamelloides]